MSSLKSIFLLFHGINFIHREYVAVLKLQRNEGNLFYAASNRNGKGVDQGLVVFCTNGDGEREIFCFSFLTCREWSWPKGKTSLTWLIGEGRV